jgi:hypothetical protein
MDVRLNALKQASAIFAEILSRIPEYARLIERLIPIMDMQSKVQ